MQISSNSGERKKSEKRWHRSISSENTLQLSFFRKENWQFALKNEPPFYPFWMEEVERRNYLWYQEHYCYAMFVVIVLGGSIRYRFHDTERVIRQGEIIVIPPQESYYFETGPDGFYKKIVLELAGKNLSSNLESLGLNQIMILPADNYLKLADDIRRIGDLLQARRQEDVPALLGDSFRFLVELAMMLPQNQVAPDIFNRAQKMLEQRLERPLSIVELAAEVGCSLTTLERLFRQKLGLTPLQYRNERKVEQARFLLLNTSLSLKEIADQLGYCHQFHFSREFRKFTGQSPRLFRRQRV